MIDIEIRTHWRIKRFLNAISNYSYLLPVLYLDMLKSRYFHCTIFDLICTQRYFYYFIITIIAVSQKPMELRFEISKNFIFHESSLY